MRRFISTIIAVAILLIQPLAVQAEPLVIGWENLVPKFLAGKRMKLPKNAEVLGNSTAQELNVSQAELEAFLGDIEIMKEFQPKGIRLNGKLNGKQVRIPGYVTPVGLNGDDITEFLLVPFLGACIHVPPPAANQIVYVKNAKGLKLAQVWEPIWLTGTMTTKSVTTILADVGYTMMEGVVEPYEAYPEDIRSIH